MKERRKFMRFNASVDVRYSVPGMAIEGLSLSKDVSREGMGFPVNRMMPIGTPLELELNIPGKIAPVFARAEVAWVKELAERADFDAGVKVLKVDPFDRSRLLEYVYEEWLKAVSKVEK